MKHTLPIFTATLLFTATALLGQEPAPTPTDKADKAATRARTDASREGDVSYGRVKELTAGQKVVIDVDNAPDKTFDLADKDLKVKMPKALKVGDTVKVVEHSALGKTTSVTIAKHSGAGVAHGDKDPAAKKP